MGVPGLLKGLGLTLRTALTPAATVQYPHVKPELPARTRGVIALMEENCTVCMLCAKECPDWCIYIDSSKETVPIEGGRTRTRNVLDRFAIDFSLCMYCGICVEVCPFDALFWSPEFEYSTFDIRELTHEKDQLRAWMDTVPPPDPLEAGATTPPELEAGFKAAREEARKAAAPAEEAAPAAAPSGAPAGADTLDHEEKIDRAVLDRYLADGAAERVARAKAKAAYAKAMKKGKAAGSAAAPGEASPAGQAPAGQAPAEQAPAEQAPAEADTLDHEEKIDRAVLDRYLADGAEERVARAKAKAAYAKAMKRQKGGEG